MMFSSHAPIVQRPEAMRYTGDPADNALKNAGVEVPMLAP
jgi:hypothetical protein